ERHHLVAIAHDDRQMVAGRQAHVLEPAGDAPYLRVPGAVIAAHVAVDDRVALRRPLDGKRECCAEIHGYTPLLPASSAASRTARTIEAYPVQRQMCPDSMSRTSASLGCGCFARNWVADIRMPGVQ